MFQSIVSELQTSPQTDFVMVDSATFKYKCPAQNHLAGNELTSLKLTPKISNFN